MGSQGPYCDRAHMLVTRFAHVSSHSCYQGGGGGHHRERDAAPAQRRDARRAHARRLRAPAVRRDVGGAGGPGRGRGEGRGALGAPLPLSPRRHAGSARALCDHLHVLSFDVSTRDSSAVVLSVGPLCRDSGCSYSY